MTSEEAALQRKRASMARARQHIRRAGPSTTHVTFRLDSDVLTRIEQEAEALGLTRSQYIAQTLTGVAHVVQGREEDRFATLEAQVQRLQERFERLERIALEAQQSY
jgi:predicted transcriptional regulator